MTRLIDGRQCRSEVSFWKISRMDTRKVMADQIPKYIALLNWTDQGMRGQQDLIKRAKACRAGIAAMGGVLGEVHWTNGPYDVILTFEAPVSETGAKVGLANIGLGNARWRMLCGCDEKEKERLIGELA